MISCHKPLIESGQPRPVEDEIPNLRNNQDLVAPFARTNFALKMPLALFPKICNDLENDVKYDSSQNIFQKN
jgi:hypothetical protein